MSDRLSGTDEGAKTEFNATEAIIENFCRPIVGRGGPKGVKPVEFFPSGWPRGSYLEDHGAGAPRDKQLGRALRSRDAAVLPENYSPLTRAHMSTTQARMRPVDYSPLTCAQEG